MAVKKVRVFGDSISLHYRKPMAEMTQGLIAIDNLTEEPKYVNQSLDDPMGLNCGDSRRVLTKLTAMYESHDTDFYLLLLNCGLHDVKRDRATNAIQVPIDEYRNNLVKIVSLVPDANNRVIWVRTTPVEDNRHNAIAQFNRYISDVDAYNTVADEVMVAHGILIADLYTFTKNLPGEIFRDHVHYLEPVCNLQAAFLAGHILASR